MHRAELDSTVSRVVGLSKIKEKHKSFEAKRALRDAHNIFLADDRIVSLLPQFLGKTFYGSKKNPMPISIPKNIDKVENFKLEVKKALGSTYLHLSPGTCTSIKVGVAGQTAEEISENIEVVANRVVDQYVPQKWKGLRSLHIKTSSSVALPLWVTDRVFSADVDVIKAPGGLPATGESSVEGAELKVDISGPFKKKRKTLSSKIPEDIGKAEKGMVKKRKK